MGHARRDEKYRWTSGIVPYTISPDVLAVNEINAALNYLESVTNLRFVRRLQQTNYIEYSLDTTLFTNRADKIGMEGGGPHYIFLNLTNSNSVSQSNIKTIIHETCHALGIKHEHQRSDRDSYITVIDANILTERANDFKKLPDTDFIHTAVYDYASIMHYTSGSASSNGQATIVPVDPAISPALLGSSTLPTATDISFLGQLYPKLGVVRRSRTYRNTEEPHEINMVRLEGTRQLITAISNKDRNLQLLAWEIDGRGGITRRRAAASAGECSNVSILQMSEYLVTVLRNGSGRLVAISWRLNGIGEPIVRVADSGTLAGDATLIKSIRLGNRFIVTACRADNGDLKLILWRIRVDGSFERLADSGTQAGDVSEISLNLISGSGNQFLLSTTVLAANKRLKLITWFVSTSGNSIERRGDTASLLEEGTMIRCCRHQNYLVISYAAGILKKLTLLLCSVSADGRQIQIIADSKVQAGQIKMNSIIDRGYGVLSGILDNDGNVSLIKWRIDNAGAISLFGDSSDQAKEASYICMENIENGATSEAPVVCGLKDGSNALCLITWDDLSLHGESQR